MGVKSEKYASSAFFTSTALKLSCEKLKISEICCIFVIELEKEIKNMAMTIKTSPELWGEDARIFTEEAERNGKLPTPKLSESQRKVLSTMLESAKKIIFPPRKG